MYIYVYIYIYIYIYVHIYVCKIWGKPGFFRFPFLFGRMDHWKMLPEMRFLLEESHLPAGAATEWK